MKKTTYLASALIMGLFSCNSVFAADLQSVQNKLESLNVLLLAATVSVPFKSQRELEYYDCVLDNTLNTINDRSFRYRPCAGGSTVPTLPSSKKYSVTGTIGKDNFNFSVTDAMDFAAQCADNFREGSKVYEASVSYDFGRSKKFSSTYESSSTGHMCAKLAVQTIRQGLKSYEQGLNNVYMLAGSFGKKNFSIRANSRGALYQECLEITNSEEKAYSYYAFTGKELSTYSSTYEPISNGEACNSMLKKAFNN